MRVTVADVRLAGVPGSAISHRLAHLSLRYAAVGTLVFLLGAVHLKQRPGTLCVLRASTGVPCPFCGGTTSAVNLAHGDVVDAFRASPIAPLMLLAWPLVGAVRSPSWWQSRRLRWSLIAAALVVAEVWQLFRFGVVGG